MRRTDDQLYRCPECGCAVYLVDRERCFECTYCGRWFGIGEVEPPTSDYTELRLDEFYNHIDKRLKRAEENKYV
jgi:hypothetical protein